ncbi:hypothetical protein ACGLWX_18260 [Halomonas sp. HMF6819]|uniref:hypothetical protein n=1 Tax=Halomonas sp. HMF6819 TaxID=3373085 RepID=UPI00379E7F79
MQKPIEVGCRVVVVDANDPKLIGASGIVTERSPDYVVASNGASGVFWGVSSTNSFHKESCLRRIDGYDPSADETEQEVTHDVEAFA